MSDKLAISLHAALPVTHSRLPLSLYFYPRAFAAKPNAAHVALAKFSIESIRKRTAPDATFTLITQNVDGLSARALEDEEQTQNSPQTADSDSTSAAAGQPGAQPRLLEMHGKLSDVLCSTDECGHREPAPNSPICAALGGTEELVEDGVVEPIVNEADLPHCTKCGALTRPGVVWFGETPHHLTTIDRLVDQADLCLVVGTSSTVSRPKWEVRHGRCSPEVLIGVSCGFLYVRSEGAWRKGRDIQRGEEQR